MFIIKGLIFKLIYIFFFLFISLNKSFSAPYCDGKKKFNLDQEIVHPEKIDVIINKSQKWYMNIISLNGHLGSRIWKHKVKIPNKFKKSFSGKIKVYFKEKIECEFSAKIKIHGGRGDHIDNLYTSLDIKLLDSHINNNSNFILFLPNTRNYDNEIFVTSLAKEINLLSPNSFITEVKVNDQKRRKFIFQEEINSQFLWKNDRYKETILLANKSWQIANFFPSLHESGFRLSRAYVDNDKHIVLNEALLGLDLLNYHIINNLNYLKDNKFFKENSLSFYLEGHGEHNFLDYKDNIFFKSYNLFSRFDAFLLVTESLHALNLFDRKYTYSYFDNEIYPIYYDGESNILDKNSVFKNKILDNKKIFKHQKLGAEYLKNQLSNFNINQFKTKLEKKNLYLSEKEIKSAITKVNNNLDFLLSLEVIELKEPKNNYLMDQIRSTKDLFLAFDGKDNIFTICKFNFANVNECSILPKSRKGTIDIIKNQITVSNGKKIIYLRKTAEDYLKNKMVKKKINERFKETKINETDRIYFNRNDTDIVINKEKKIIKINAFSPNERVLIKAKNIDNWSIFYEGNFINSFIRNTRAHELDVLLTSCVTFYESLIENVNLNINNPNCEDALDFKKTYGSIKNILINNAFYDAVDADHSDLIFQNIIVKGAGQECLGLKKGNYIVEKFKASECGDKAISVGEQGLLKILNADIKNSKYGLVSKDSSVISANKVTIEKTDICFSAYRLKNNFEGSFLSIKNLISKDCNKEKIILEEGSTILY